MAQLVAGDFSVQAAIFNVLVNVQLIAEAARGAGTASPPLDVCHTPYRETPALGFSGADMVAVIRAIEQRAAAAV
ncbi:MAG: hypothetical protein ACRECE_01320 [Xanthobacteraceae bacterium]